MLLCWTGVFAAVVSLVGASSPVAARAACADYDNCFACSAAAECGWCGSANRCQEYADEASCPFTLWKGTCCRTVTPRGCGECLREAGCGWCQHQGCAEGGEEGPAQGGCGEWYFEACFAPSVEIRFAAPNVMLGLTATIGGGLVLACLAALFVFIRRQVLQRQATREFQAFLKTHRNSCAVCEDIVATFACRDCGDVLCAGCSEETWCGRSEARKKHSLKPISKGASQDTTAAYESFAHLSNAARSINYDD